MNKPTIDETYYDKSDMILFAIGYGDESLDNYEDDSPYSLSTTVLHHSSTDSYELYTMRVGAWVSWGINSKRINRVLRWYMDRYFRHLGFRHWNTADSSLAYIRVFKESTMINLFYDEIDLIETGVPVSEYRDRVSHPGKFESESAYVPYFWDNLMLWGDPPDDTVTEAFQSDLYGYEAFDYPDGMPEVYGYDVDLIDYVLFPELLEESIVRVYLYEDEQGFVNVYDTETIILDEPKTVEDIDSNYLLVTDSQEILAIGESIGMDVSNYGCLFVKLGEGEYTSVYGCESIVPYNYKRVDKLL